MHQDHLAQWTHSHTFDQDLKRPGESRTLIVIFITGVMMVVEIVTGILFGSMALLADGLHMASHTAALTINLLAYVLARRHADNPSFSFGTGKINALGGFTGAILLAGFAMLMIWESFHRLVDPVEIVFNQAIMVAVLGLVVNGASVVILGFDHHDQDHDHEHEHEHSHHRHDHNLRSAYLHVLADALTSVLAIVALLAAKYFGYVWMDPLMGIVGAILVSRWSWGLLKSTGATLLDRQAPEALLNQVRACLEDEEHARICDLHLWSIGPGIYAAIISIVAHEPESPAAYKRRLPSGLGLVHVSIEVHQTTRDGAAPPASALK